MKICLFYPLLYELALEVISRDIDFLLGEIGMLIIGLAWIRIKMKYLSEQKSEFSSRCTSVVELYTRSKEHSPKVLIEVFKKKKFGNKGYSQLYLKKQGFRRL